MDVRALCKLKVLYEHKLLEGINNLRMMSDIIERERESARAIGSQVYTCDFWIEQNILISQLSIKCVKIIN